MSNYCQPTDRQRPPGNTKAEPIRSQEGQEPAALECQTRRVWQVETGLAMAPGTTAALLAGSTLIPGWISIGQSFKKSIWKSAYMHYDCVILSLWLLWLLLLFLLLFPQVAFQFSECSECSLCGESHTCSDSPPAACALPTACNASQWVTPLIVSPAPSAHMYRVTVQPLAIHSHQQRGFPLTLHPRDSPVFSLESARTHWYTEKKHLTNTQG